MVRVAHFLSSLLTPLASVVLPSLSVFLDRVCWRSAFLSHVALPAPLFPACLSFSTGRGALRLWPPLFFCSAPGAVTNA